MGVKTKCPLNERTNKIQWRGSKRIWRQAPSVWQLLDVRGPGIFLYWFSFFLRPLTNIYTVWYRNCTRLRGSTGFALAEVWESSFWALVSCWSKFPIPSFYLKCKRWPTPRVALHKHCVSDHLARPLGKLYSNQKRCKYLNNRIAMTCLISMQVLTVAFWTHVVAARHFNRACGNGGKDWTKRTSIRGMTCRICWVWNLLMTYFLFAGVRNMVQSIEGFLLSNNEDLQRYEIHFQKLL